MAHSNDLNENKIEWQCWDVTPTSFPGSLSFPSPEYPSLQLQTYVRPISTGAAIIMTGRREPWERGWCDSSLLAWEQPRSPGRSWNWPMHNRNAYTTHRAIPRISRNVLRSYKEKRPPVLSQEFTDFFDGFVPSTFESSQLISVYIRRQGRISVIVGTRDVSISSAYKIDSKRQTNASTPPKAIERIRFTWSTGSSG